MSRLSIETVGLAVITMVVIGTLAVFGSQRVLNLDERIAMRTVEIPTARVDSSVYMMDSLEEAELEMNFGRNYSIVTRNGDPYLKYEMNEILISKGETSAASEINPPRSLDFNFREGESNKFCITKSPENLILKPESC